MNKIISRFYLITIDNKPVYVGYTNRTVKQRFREHIKDKDLPEGAEVKQIDKLKFDFTWDINKVNDNANLVSKRENELILKYKTQDSVYQKGLSDKLGYNNKDNPKYNGMNSHELLVYLDSYRKRIIKLKNFISGYRDPRISKLKNFIGGYKDHKLDKLQGFINNSYKDPRISKLKGFIGSYKDPRIDKIQVFINSYKDPRIDRLKGFISNYHDPRLTKLKGFISSYKDHRLTKLSNFINHYKDPRMYKLQVFVSSYKDPRLLRLYNFIARYKING